MKSEFELNEQDLLRMERYFRGELPADEQTVFENELNMNPGLKQKYEELRLLFVGIGEASLQEKLAGFHADVKKEESPARPAKTIAIRSWLLVAACAAALVIGAWLIFFNANAGERTFEAWFKPDPGLPTLMGTTNSYEFDKAMVDYKAGNYKAAIAGWESLRKRDTANDTLNYFLGVALLADGQTENALVYLLPIAEKGMAQKTAFGLQNEALWYAGLALIRLERYNEAAPYIRTTEHEGKKEVLEKLEKKVKQ